MANLTTTFAGIQSLNPFWLASAPPTNTGKQIMRTFEAGWGGAVWKTIGVPARNVSSRLSALDHGPNKMIGLNNIELISDRSVEENLKEMEEVKRKFPNHTVIASLMVETRDEWKKIIHQVQDVGADGIELNFGCPHGMCERGMGSAVGQEPKLIEMITAWAKEFSRVPVIVKLTPNVTDINVSAGAARRGGADAVSLINTVKSIISVDIEQFVPLPVVGISGSGGSSSGSSGRSSGGSSGGSSGSGGNSSGSSGGNFARGSEGAKGTNGGYCGPAVKPIALHMVASIARKYGPTLPISGIGGISTWKDAVEFMTLGAGNVQVCTAVMHYGYRIVEDLIQGLSNYLDRKGFDSVQSVVGKAVPQFTDWSSLDQEFHHVATIHESHCIGCNLCVVTCDDGGHQCIDLNPQRHTAGATHAPIVRHEECVGCNLCMLVCPSPGAITMTPATRHHHS